MVKRAATTLKAQPAHKGNTRPRRAPAQETSAPAPEKPIHDKAQEAQELTAILQGHVILKRNKAYLQISSETGNPITCTLASEAARSWAFSQYAQLHSGALPLVESYKTACANTGAALLLTSEQGEQSQDEDEQEALIEMIRERAAFLLDTSSPLACYACVPYLPGEADMSAHLTGIWRLQGKKQAQRLTSAFLIVERIAVPLFTSHGKDFHFTLSATNAQGAHKSFQISRDDLEAGELEAKFLGFASYPKTRNERERLNDALQYLAQRPGVKRQEEADSLGWQVSEQHGMVWVCSNGIETLQHGFISAQDAPFLPPALLSPGNGYTGTNDIPPCQDDIWYALLGALNNANNSRVYAKLTAYMRLLLPPGALAQEEKERAGKLPFPIETIGAPRHGKSVEENFILSLYGTGFDYKRETFLQERNTMIGRLGLQAKMRHVLYTDYDHKASEQGALFEKQHQARHDAIIHYSDGANGGTVGTKTGGIRARSNPTGGMLTTGNHDHAPYSIAHDELADECRIMTFIWPQGEKSNDDVSREIDARRVELYAWGVSSRKWIMACSLQGEKFTRLVSRCYREATELVMSERYNWKCDLHRNQVIECVAMARLWIYFLKARHAETMLIHWFEEQTSLFIADRLTRCEQIADMDASHKGEQGVTEFVLEAIRGALGSARLYLLSQQCGILAEDTVSRPLTSYGYRLVNRSDGEMIDTGAIHGGYYLKASNAIGFIPDALYQYLSREAKEKRFTLLPRPDLFKRLADEGIVIPTLKNGEYKRYEHQVKIKGAPQFLVVIPHDLIYSPALLSEGETVIDNDGQETTYTGEQEPAQEDGKVIHFPRSSEQSRAQERAQPGEQVVNAPVSLDSHAVDPDVFNTPYENIEDISEYTGV